MYSAQIGLMILCVIAFFMVVVCEVTIYLMRRFFRFLDNRKNDKNKIAELERQLRDKTDSKHKKMLEENSEDVVKNDEIPFS